MVVSCSNPILVQMSAEGSNADCSCGDAGGYQQALVLIHSNDLARLKDTLDGMDDSHITEADSCGVTRAFFQISHQATA